MTLHGVKTVYSLLLLVAFERGLKGGLSSWVGGFVKRFLVIVSFLALLPVLGCSSSTRPITAAEGTEPALVVRVETATQVPTVEPTATNTPEPPPPEPTATPEPPPPRTAPAAIRPTAPAPQPPAPAAPANPAPPALPPAPRPSGPASLSVRAQNLAFAPGGLTVSAGSSVTVTLTNQDLSVPHDIGFTIPGAPRTGSCAGPCTASVSFTAPGPGTYAFTCSTHPELMTGRLTVTN
jgi:plastocyanin